MKKRHDSHGFGIVELLLVVVIVGLIAGTGYYVMQKRDDKTATATSGQQKSDQKDVRSASLGKGCTAGPMKGKTYTAIQAVYSICIPNGWHINDYSENASAGALDTSAAGMVYTASVKPAIATGGGHDGASAFGLYFNTPAAGAPTSYNLVGPFEAGNVTGTEYARTETEDPGGVGLGTVPQGTQQHAYYFEKDGKSIEIDYNLFPGDTDYTEAASAVANTLTFN